ncbi:MAG: hypothetical protein SH809_05455 [Rhodothermales bacterium]|nr:hypothetical protein [Rhodothermales bacterium]
MSDKFEFHWGDTVRVRLAPEESCKTEQLASICGIREDGGLIMYLVEFSDGSTFELPEERLMKFDENSLKNC